MMGTSSNILTQTSFVINAPLEKVWRLLGSAVFQCLPLERMDIVDQTHFNAVLRWKLAFVKIPLNLKTIMDDIVAPTTFGCVIQIEKGIMKLGTRVTFNLKAIGEDKTEIDCVATKEGERTLLGRITGGQQRSFSENVFSSIRTRLEQLC
ncbi:hypothetical protein ACFLV0_06540, partial [Chloroflexota bacterium]